MSPSRVNTFSNQAIARPNLNKEFKMNIRSIRKSLCYKTYPGNNIKWHGRMTFCQPFKMRCAIRLPAQPQGKLKLVIYKPTLILLFIYLPVLSRNAIPCQENKHLTFLVTLETIQVSPLNEIYECSHLLCFITLIL